MRTKPWRTVGFGLLIGGLWSLSVKLPCLAIGTMSRSKEKMAAIWAEHNLG
jgi:hypothetical protein